MLNRGQWVVRFLLCTGAYCQQTPYTFCVLLHLPRTEMDPCTVIIGQACNLIASWDLDKKVKCREIAIKIIVVPFESAD